MSRHALDEGDHERQEQGRHTEHRDNAVSVAALLADAIREGRALWVGWGGGSGLVTEEEEEEEAQLNLGKTKTYELITTGEIDSVNIGRLRRIHIDSVRAYAARLVAQRNINRQH